MDLSKSNFSGDASYASIAVADVLLFKDDNSNPKSLGNLKMKTRDSCKYGNQDLRHSN